MGRCHRASLEKLIASLEKLIAVLSSQKNFMTDEKSVFEWQEGLVETCLL
jgi:hypothetical protein